MSLQLAAVKSQKSQIIAETALALDIVIANVHTAYHSVRGNRPLRDAHSVPLCPANSFCCESAYGLEQLESLRVRRKRCSHSQAGRCDGQQRFESGWLPIRQRGRLLGGPERHERLHSAVERFPDMKALGDYIHSKGLKFGIYSSPGAKTCAKHEGSYGHEQQDADSYAKWGVDYLKYDWCSARDVYKPAEYPDVRWLDEAVQVTCPERKDRPPGKPAYTAFLSRAAYLLRCHAAAPAAIRLRRVRARQSRLVLLFLALRKAGATPLPASSRAWTMPILLISRSSFPRSASTIPSCRGRALLRDVQRGPNARCRADQFWPDRVAAALRASPRRLAGQQDALVLLEHQYQRSSGVPGMRLAQVSCACCMRSKAGAASPCATIYPREGLPGRSRSSDRAHAHALMAPCRVSPYIRRKNVVSSLMRRRPQGGFNRARGKATSSPFHMGRLESGRSPNPSSPAVASKSFECKSPIFSVESLQLIDLTALKRLASAVRFRPWPPPIDSVIRNYFVFRGASLKVHNGHCCSGPILFTEQTDQRNRPRALRLYSDYGTCQFS
jgi:hypothetical protein